jgi:hypothetical protein
MGPWQLEEDIINTMEQLCCSRILISSNNETCYSDDDDDDFIYPDLSPSCNPELRYKCDDDLTKYVSRYGYLWPK